MHIWGDEDFDWKALDDAITFIHKRFRRWRMSVSQAKEKYGTARIYMTGLGWYSLHDITHPGYFGYRYPKWLIKLDINVFSEIIPLLNVIVVRVHEYIYRDTYKKAVKKYPHIKEEICCAADYIDLISDYKEW